MSKWDGFEEAVAVADAGSFVGGGRRLGLSTSHVSRAVAKLENQIQASLFTRTTRVVTLTETGRIVIEQARRMLQERDEILDLVTGEETLHGEVRLTCSTTMGERFVAPIVRRFLERHGAIRVQLELTNRLVDLVGEGFDLGIRTGDISDGRLLAVPVASRGLRLCASPSYLASHGVPRTAGDLAGHECLMGSSSSWMFVVDGGTRLFNPAGRWRCNSGQAVLEACRAGLGICQLPDFYVSADVSSGALVQLLVEEQAEDETIWAAYPRRRHLLPKVKVLLQHLSAELAPALADV